MSKNIAVRRRPTRLAVMVASMALFGAGLAIAPGSSAAAATCTPDAGDPSLPIIDAYIVNLGSGPELFPKAITVELCQRISFTNTTAPTSHVLQRDNHQAGQPGHFSVNCTGATVENCVVAWPPAQFPTTSYMVFTSAMGVAGQTLVVVDVISPVPAAGTITITAPAPTPTPTPNPDASPTPTPTATPTPTPNASPTPTPSGGSQPPRTPGITPPATDSLPSVVSSSSPSVPLVLPFGLLAGFACLAASRRKRRRR